MRKLRLLILAFLYLLYLFNLAPTVHIHDAGEITASAWTLGLGHPPGSPLTMLLMKVFITLFPLGHIAFRANLFSSLCALLAVYLFMEVLFAITQRGTLSAFGGLFLGTTWTFWWQGEMAEVYTLEASLLLAFLYFFAHKKNRWAIFFWGLLLACHVSFAPLTPFILLLLSYPKPFSFTRWIKNIFSFLPLLFLPLSLYLYIPVRALAHPSIAWGNPQTFQDFYAYLTNQAIRGRMFTLPVGDYLLRLRDYGFILLRNLHIFLLGFLFLYKGRVKKELVFLFFALFFNDLIFTVLGDVAPLPSEAYGIPAVLALLLFLLLTMAEVLKREIFMVTLIMVGVSINLLQNIRENNLSHDFLVRDRVENLLLQTPPGALLFTQEDNTTFPLAYLIKVEGARPDLTIFDRQGNLFLSPYPRPLWQVKEVLGSFRKKIEEPMVLSFLKKGTPVAFSTAFLDYEPKGWYLVPFEGIAYAFLDGFSSPPLSPLPLRRGKTLGWMRKQLLADTLIQKAYALQWQGKREEALSFFDQAYPFIEHAELFIRLAQGYMKVEEYDKALQAVEKAVKIKPRLAPAWSLSAFLYGVKGEWKKAKEHAQKAVTLDPNLAQAYGTLGSVALKEGDFRKAIQWFTQALEREPYRADFLINRGLAYLRLGKENQGWADLQFAYQRKPTDGKIFRLVLQKAWELGKDEECLTLFCSFSRVEVSTLTPENVKGILLIGAKLGFPDCVDDFLNNLLLKSELSPLVQAYANAKRRIPMDRPKRVSPSR